MKYTLPILALLLAFIAPPTASAQASSPPAITINPVAGFSTLSQAINTLLTVAMFAGAVACLAYLVYGAFKYLTARDEAGKLEEARKTMINAAVGLLLLGLIVVIFQIVVALIPGMGSWFGGGGAGLGEGGGAAGGGLNQIAP